MRRARVTILLLVIFMGVSLVMAQGGERLVNPSFEEGSFGPYTTRRGGEFPVYLPGGWNFWFASPSGDFFNRGERATIFPHPGPGPDPKDGSRALNISCGFVTCGAAVFQQVSVTQGTNIQASAWAQVKACNPAPNATSCGSAVESGSQTRVGIDPNGGTDPNDSDIVWSGWVQPHDQWLQMSVSATTTGTTATLFLYSTQASTAAINKTYWDQASLTGGGTGGSAGVVVTVATSTPTPPPEVPFVAPQGARPDGSIVHTVGAGDTLDSIAVAYSVTRSDILALNNIPDPRIIRIGQELLIREASQAAPTNTPQPTEAVTAPDQGGDVAPVVTAPDAAVLAIVPQLVDPEGVVTRQNSRTEGTGGPEGQRAGFISSILLSEATAEAIISGFNTQLAAAGWQQVSGGVGAGFAWGIWRFEDSSGTVWGGTLTITASPINVGQYTMMLQIEQGPSLG
jgi:LysM repeat protein